MESTTKGGSKLHVHTVPLYAIGRQAYSVGTPTAQRKLHQRRGQ